MDQPADAKTTTKPAIKALDAHHRFMTACGTAALAFAGLHGNAAFATQLVSAWDVFAFTIIVLSWFMLSTQDPYEARRNARLQDTSRTALFVIVIAAATVSLFAVFILLGSVKELSPGSFAAHVTLSVSAIVLSWMLVHTLFCLRYAHLYYAGAHQVDRDDVEGGLIFPQDKNPDYLDFAYFSFVIGMTCQVSDVQISSKRMRRLATVHGLISFVFNTAILAMFVNIVAGLI
ncbi:MAG: DUF1345 domain-containing protein [Methylacidiphilales bacterium]|nr:DUF1345 domain-containing protein [Candidatus Methylacidiphilales bacterium]